jgi:hypothetical protein
VSVKLQECSYVSLLLKDNVAVELSGERLCHIGIDMRSPSMMILNA